MPSIFVPDLYQPGIISLLQVPDEQYLHLLSALKDAKSALFVRGLVSQIAPKVDGIKSRDIREIFESLVAMYAVRARLDIPVADFAKGISEGIDDFEEAEETKFSDEEKVRLEQRLGELLAIERPLGITSKANDVLIENEHSFCNARILTDVRPIFQSDLTSEVSEAVIIHNLKITYHQDREHKDFFVAMDSEDIQTLKATIERAEAKDRSAKLMLEKANVLLLDVE